MATQANIGSLVVSVAANTAPFDKGMKKSKKSLSNFEKASKKTASSMKNLKTGLAAFGTSALLGSIANQFSAVITEMDELGKTANNLGISTEELGALQFAADRSGVAIDQMNSSLEKMARNVSQAAQGIGPAKDTLNELGLSAQRLNEQSPDEMIREIADAMVDVGTQADKIRIAESVFGRGAADMLELIKGGAGTIDGLAKEFENLGGAISQEDAEKAALFADSMTDLKAAAGAAFKDFVIDIAPAAIEAVRQLTEMYQELRKLYDENVYLGEEGTQEGTSLVQKAVLTFGNIANAIADLSNFDSAQEIRRAKLLEEFEKSTREREKNSGKTEEELSKQTSILDDIRDGLANQEATATPIDLNVTGIAS